MVSVLPLDGAVLAVEDNGWRGSEESVLLALSINGSVASMYWNVEGLRQLSFARDGELLAAFEPGISEVLTEVAPLLDDLNLADYRHLNAKGVTAVARFTGHDFDQEHFTRIEEADVIYPLTDNAQR